jgi:hypothetical protein
MQYGVYFICLVSALTAPWWITLPLIVYALSFEYSAPFVVGIGVVMDSLYGTGIPALYGLSALYTSLFLTLSLLTLFLRRRVLD